MAVAIVVALLGLTGAAKEHFVVVFGCQNDGLALPSSWRGHSFALWAEAQDGHITQTFTISWMPAQQVRILAAPELGQNKEFQETWDRYSLPGLQIVRWGPYRITEDFFVTAKHLYEVLEDSEVTGEVKWKCMDGRSRFHRTNRAINCVHAISDISGVPLRTWCRSGKAASEAIVHHFLDLDLILDTSTTHDWVWQAINGT